MEFLGTFVVQMFFNANQISIGNNFNQVNSQTALTVGCLANTYHICDALDCALDIALWRFVHKIRIPDQVMRHYRVKSSM